MAKSYDLAILGGGTGGYVAAIRASQLGLSVALVEKGELGGTCLHRGCIPSKALLRSAEVYKQTQNAVDYGVETSNVSLNFDRVQERKASIVNTLHQGVKSLMKKGKIDVFEGFGRILGPSIFSPVPGTISIEHDTDDENTMIVPQNVLIATGSSPKTLPGLAIDTDKVLTSDEALNMTALPDSMLIVGGGVIGIEWASMLSDFDVEVTVLEYADRILPTEDADISKEAEKLLKKKGIQFVTSAQVMPETLNKNNGISIDTESKGEQTTYKADKLLISVGRSANVDNIGIENTNINIENNCIQTNDMFQTKDEHIYAIGDVIGGLQLAHVASHEGIIAVEHMANEQPFPMQSEQVPICVYSAPEIARIGLTEQQATQKGIDVKIGKIPFSAVGKAQVQGDTEGFVKVIADKQNDDLIGVHMIGPSATDMISEAGLAKVLDAAAWEVGESIHPHPSLSEVMKEAALAVDHRQIHG